MFSVSPAEILTITVVALLVFGPHRLPEITRKVGRIVRDLSRAAQDLKTGIEREMNDTPLGDVRRRQGSTVESLPETPPEPEEDSE